MLLAPAFRRIADVTVFADDTVWNRFYLLAPTPQVRRREDGRPLLDLVIYAFGDEDRARDPELPRGGGYLAFDVAYAVPADVEARVVSELQAWVDAEYARRRATPEYAGRPEYAGPDAPRVELATPTWCKSTARLDAPDAEALVLHAVKEQPASLVHGNTASFSMDLSSQGAVFFDQLFEGQGQPSDLTALSVAYDLAMWARMPPVTIRATVDSQRLYSLLRSVEEGQKTTGQGLPGMLNFTGILPLILRGKYLGGVARPLGARTNTATDEAVDRASLRETGIVNITTDAQDTSLPAAAVDALTERILSIVEKYVEERFLEPAELPAETLELDGPSAKPSQPGTWSAQLFAEQQFGGSPVEVAADAPDIDVRFRSVQVREGHRIQVWDGKNYSGATRVIDGSRAVYGAFFHARSVRVYRPAETRKKVRNTYDEATMKIEVSLTRSQVIEWPWSAAGMLESFFEGMSRADIKKHVRRMTLDDPMFTTLGLAMRVQADFSGLLAAVDVEVSYEGRDASGKLVKRVPTHDEMPPFTAANEVRRWSPTLLSGSRTYQYRWRAVYKGGAGDSGWSEWETTDDPSPLISVPDPGRLQVNLIAVAMPWAFVRTVEAHVRYEDAELDVAPVEALRVLEAATPTAVWQHSLIRPQRRPIAVQLRYTYTDGRTEDGPAIETPGGDVVVPPPPIDVLDVTLLPTGDWSDVNQVIVDLKADGTPPDAAIPITAPDQARTWQVLLRDSSRRQFQYRVLVSYKGTSPAAPEPAWKTRDGDGTLLVEVPSLPRIKGQVLPAVVDFARTPLVTVTLERGAQRVDLTFDKPESRSFAFALAPGEDPSYRRTITYHTKDGRTLTVGPETSREVDIVIPRPSLPEPGKLAVTARGDFGTVKVDFAATPLVEVRLSLTDAATGRTSSTVLSLDATTPKAAWEVDVSDVQNQRYRYEITWYLADGTPVPGPSGDSASPSLIVPAYTPPA